MALPSHLLLLLLLALLVSLASTQGVCTSATARPIDGEVAAMFGATALLWGEVGVDIAGIVGRRSIQIRFAFSCTSGEECLSLKDHPFCYNQQTKNFHGPEGTTGNVQTGDYTLADGEQGNLYKGPWPTPDGSLAAVTASSVAPSSSTLAVPTTVTNSEVTTGTQTATGTGTQAATGTGPATATVTVTKGASSGASPMLRIWNPVLVPLAALVLSALLS